MSNPIKDLRKAHLNMRKAEKELAQAIERAFPIGSHAIHTKGTQGLMVEVENVNSDSVKVRNLESGKSQWVHYYHFLNPERR